MMQKQNSAPDMILRRLASQLPGSQFRTTPRGIPLVHHLGHRVGWWSRQAEYRVFSGHRDAADSTMKPFKTEADVIAYFAGLVMKPVCEDVTCPYCHSPAVIRPGSYIYGPGRLYRDLYVCTRYPACDAYVGVEEGTTRPIGTLANAALREARRQAHLAFDPLWEGKTKFTKVLAYRAAAALLGVERFHIGWSDEEACLKVIDNIRHIKSLMETDDVHPLHHCQPAAQPLQPRR